MSGSIRVESLPGKGSRFLVEVPVDPAGQHESSTAKTKAFPIIGVAQGEPEYRILVVEGRAEDRAVLQRLLEGAGFLVRTAEDGRKLE
jgi:PleD family two-component response regulator